MYPKTFPGQEGEQLAKQLVPSDQLRLIITGDTTEAIETLTKKAEEIGKAITAMSTSQIRNIFGTVRTIEQEVKMLDADKPLPISVQRSLQMLRPKLAYQYGRAQKEKGAKAMGVLTHILSEAISLVGSNVKYFRNFMDFFEAILAYHRRFGGSTN